MTRAEIENTVREIMQTVLKRSIPSGGEVRRADVATWDSLAHVNLVFSIESELGVQFSAEELGSLDSLKKLAEAASRLRLGP